MKKTFNLGRVIGPEGPRGLQGIPGERGPEGKVGPKGDKGKDGITPLIKIGKVESSDTYGGADVKMRFGKGNIIYLDFTLPIGRQGFAGLDGKDATINGVNTLNIVAGDNIILNQDGDILKINSTGSGSQSDIGLSIVDGLICVTYEGDDN